MNQIYNVRQGGFVDPQFDFTNPRAFASTITEEEYEKIIAIFKECFREYEIPISHDPEIEISRKDFFDLLAE